MAKLVTVLLMIVIMWQVFLAKCERPSNPRVAESQENISMKTIVELIQHVITELKDFKSTTNDAFLHVGTQLRSQEAKLENLDVVQKQHSSLLKKLLKNDEEESVKINDNSKAIASVEMLIKEELGNITNDVREVKEILTSGKFFIRIWPMVYSIDGHNVVCNTLT